MEKFISKMNMKEIMVEIKEGLLKMVIFSILWGMGFYEGKIGELHFLIFIPLVWTTLTLMDSVGKWRND